MNGSYLLVIEIKYSKIIKIGNLGKMNFKNGFYVYTGSALNGLEKRIERHLRKNKKIHWHIDFLLKYANIVKIFYKKSELREECIIANLLNEKLSLIYGFGCSDCTCKSHLFYGSYEEIKNAITNLELKDYLIDKNS